MRSKKVVRTDDGEFTVWGDGDILEFMSFTPHPMSRRMVWKARTRFGRAWPVAMWQAFRGRGPWTENLTDHELDQVESYLADRWGISRPGSHGAQ